MKGLSAFTLRFLLHLSVALAGLLGGGLAIYIHLVRSGPGLETWHKEILKHEFRASHEGKEIEDFSDYLALEEKLFAELDERIYEDSPRGPDQALVRYSRGSLADPGERSPNWNRSFELVPKNPVGGVLLLHGMSDSPYSLRSLGHAFHEAGYHVLGLRFPGHGTLPSGLLQLTWEDMAASTRLAIKHLAEVLPGEAPLHLVGYSTGAPLAIDYSLDALEGETDLPLPESLVLLSPSLGITPAAALAAWKRRLGRLPGLGKMAWTGILPEFDPYKYNSFTANAGDQVHRLTREIAVRVQSASHGGPLSGFPRTLVFLSTVDATVSVDAAIDNLLEHLDPGDGHELFLFDINRSRIASSLMVADPAPLTRRLFEEENHPFHLELIGNADRDDLAIVSRRKNALTGEILLAPLARVWPDSVLSLSHVALPFSPEDPLYGRREFAGNPMLHLGELAIQGERNLLRIPSDWLLRLRFNPFYDLLEERALTWVKESSE